MREEPLADGDDLRILAESCRWGRVDDEASDSDEEESTREGR
jgi:hypothetical protein